MAKDDDGMLDEAIARLAAALEIEPDHYGALNDWGCVLLTKAARRSGAACDDLLDQAAEKLRAAEDVAPGPAAYNLACLHGLRGEDDEARRWLLKAEAADALPDADHMALDADLASVHETEWFEDLLARRRQAEGQC